MIFLTGRKEKKGRAMKLGISPTIPTIGSLYQDTQLLGMNQYQEALRAAAVSVTPRPATRDGEKIRARHYQSVENGVWRTCHRDGPAQQRQIA